MRKGILFLLFVLLLSNAALAENEVCIYFFYGTGCPHCANVEEYLQTIEPNYPDMVVHSLNAATESELLYGLYESYNVPSDKQGAVPVLFIGDNYFLGDTPIIENLETEINNCVACECPQPAETTAGIPLAILLGLAAFIILALVLARILGLI